MWGWVGCLATGRVCSAMPLWADGVAAGLHGCLRSGGLPGCALCCPPCGAGWCSAAVLYMSWIFGYVVCTSGPKTPESYCGKVKQRKHGEVAAGTNDECCIGPKFPWCEVQGKPPWPAVAYISMYLVLQTGSACYI